MARKNKYIYYWVIQGYYSGSYGWEDESFYDKSECSYSEVKKDLKEYRIACPQAGHRIIERRELNPEYMEVETVEVAV